jgi:hypothetical protein
VVEAASRIAADGTLHADPTWHDERTVGATRRFYKHGIEGERAAIVCAGSGLAIGQLGDLVPRERV